MYRLKKLALWLTLFVLLFTLAGFLAVPPVAKWFLVKGS